MKTIQNTAVKSLGLATSPVAGETVTTTTIDGNVTNTVTVEHRQADVGDLQAMVSLVGNLQAHEAAQKALIEAQQEEGYEAPEKSETQVIALTTDQEKPLMEFLENRGIQTVVITEDNRHIVNQYGKFLGDAIPENLVVVIGDKLVVNTAMVKATDDEVMSAVRVTETLEFNFRQTPTSSKQLIGLMKSMYGVKVTGDDGELLDNIVTGENLQAVEAVNTAMTQQLTEQGYFDNFVVSLNSAGELAGQLKTDLLETLGKMTSIPSWKEEQYINSLQPVTRGEGEDEVTTWETNIRFTEDTTEV